MFFSILAAGEEVRLKKFAKIRLEITESGDEESEIFETFCADSLLSNWVYIVANVFEILEVKCMDCLLYTSPSPRDS